MKFKAPWSKVLIGMSIFGTAICLMVPIINFTPLQRGGPDARVFWLPLLLVFGAALFTIRGYEISSDALLVKRLFWSTRIPLSTLKAACFEPRAMKGSLRTFGNGGFFSFSGWYWSKRLGAYRAFVTNPQNTVILEFEKRKIVVSPENPEQFVESLLKRN
jgi:hypothetical protein